MIHRLTRLIKIKVCVCQVEIIEGIGNKKAPSKNERAFYIVDYNY